MNELIIGARESPLALKQVELFTGEYGVTGSLRKIKTLGDKGAHGVIDQFTRELDLALLDNTIDLAIHSLKDIPVEFPEGLEIAAVCERGDPRDCLITRMGVTLNGLPSEAVVGTCSERRNAELLNLRSDLKPKPIRGNIGTRLDKLDSGEYDAIVLAKCALDRLDQQKRIAQVFRLSEMVPAAGQGAIAIVKRKSDSFGFLKKSTGYTCCMLEREFIKGLGGCRNPVGAYCSYSRMEYSLTGLIYKDGARLIPRFVGSSEKIEKDIKAWKEEFI
jgi:hydroxymethylbilane synthase